MSAANRRRGGSSKKRARAAAGHWPVADREPHVIELLRGVSHLNSPAVMTDDARAALLDEVATILTAWSAREDVAELRHMLGVAPARGRRRTQRQVNLEHAIAFAYAVFEDRGEQNPLLLVSEDFNKSTRTVEKALEGWIDMARREVKAIRQHFTGPIDHRMRN